jgi:hypothetical protein
MAEHGNSQVESVCGADSTVGSNPAATATSSTNSAPPCFVGEGLTLPSLSSSPTCDHHAARKPIPIRRSLPGSSNPSC